VIDCAFQDFSPAFACILIKFFAECFQMGQIFGRKKFHVKKTSGRYLCVWLKHRFVLEAFVGVEFLLFACTLKEKMVLSPGLSGRALLFGTLPNPRSANELARCHRHDFHTHLMNLVPL
jgi:hypothetical protein